MTIKEIRQGICLHLQKAGLESAEYETRILMETFLGISREDLILEPGREIPEEACKQLYEVVSLREKRIPLQQLTGQAPFMGYIFYVNKDVLIPRMDTECLVEEALNQIKELETGGKNQDYPVRVLDLCTGSGCIGISLKLLCPKASVCLSDLSEEALAVARENARRLEADVEICQGDLFENVSGKYDMIISNPPYIPSRDIEELMPEVRDHEPVMALDGEEDGLAFYRRIIREAGSRLNPGGRILFEIGAWQGEDVSRLLREEGFSKVRVLKDLAGLDRVAEAAFES